MEEGCGRRRPERSTCTNRVTTTNFKASSLPCKETENESMLLRTNDVKRMLIGRRGFMKRTIN